MTIELTPEQRHEIIAAIRELHGVDRLGFAYAALAGLDIEDEPDVEAAAHEFVVAMTIYCERMLAEGDDDL